MEPIRRIGQPTFERGGGRDERVSVRFKLNREPDTTWMDLFKSHAASSVLGGANAIFRGSEVCIELAKTTGMPELTTAVDCFIECANLKLRSFPGRIQERRSTLSPFRPRVRGSI
jgi:hypothetical protein